MKSVEELRVLVVDDNMFSRAVLTKSIGHLGVNEIATAENGREALSHVENAQVDILICDLNMPEMDGVEFLRHLAAREYDGNIVLVSGEDRRILDTVERLAGAHMLNVLGAVPKPLESEQLKELLDRTAEGRKTASRGPVELVSKEDLQNGLASNEITLHYQPKVSTSDRRLIGVECLVRWQRPDGSMVWPDEFIPAAEEYGLIDSLTEVVLKTAVRQGDAWLRDGLAIKVAINVSVKNLRSIQFPNFVSAVMERSKIGAHNIIVEITESQIMQDVLIPLEILTRLRLRGFALSIDDFGTGYSSLEQLKSIPFNEMKIDRAFVHGAARDSAARAILESSIDLARKLDMSVVAEGVEDQEDWDLVASLGVDLVQGYFIARPMDAAAFNEWVLQQ